MYNRYTRNDTGSYTRMPQKEAPPSTPPSPPPRPSAPLTKSISGSSASERDLLNNLLAKFHLDDLDSGDLLVLLMLFLLIREKADEELLIALGLLLIL